MHPVRHTLIDVGIFLIGLSLGIAAIAASVLSL
jgi:hypothetical protein